MVLKLYDLAGADDERRFSPYCWRIKMALRHKKLDVEEIPWRFVEKERIANSSQELVPVLIDGEKMIADSWEIARYLEVTYPNLNPLFGGAIALGETLFIKFWCEQTLHPILMRLLVTDIFQQIHPKDKAYFRESREQRFGMTLEEFATPSEEAIATFTKALAPLRATLERQPYIGGTQAYFADYIVFGAFQWARAVSPIQLLMPHDPIYTWRERLLNAFDGYARNALGYPV
ncbi:MAG: glutathione S-transferase family protein [Rhizonema sp. PD38]|nr:glutathione S-transferase family protein [Rhizonema sp. PD38]